MKGIKRMCNYFRIENGTPYCGLKDEYVVDSTNCDVCEDNTESLSEPLSVTDMCMLNEIDSGGWF